ncbi:monocarboxylate transporter 12-like, partial [Argonauta hians]
VDTISCNGTKKSENINGKITERKTGESSTETSTEYKPPDGGWGWVVMISSLILIFLTDGIAFSVGTIYPTIRDDFNADSTKASLISALINAFSLFTGPVSSVMADSYGHRIVVVIGSLIAGIGFIAASFSPNIDVAIVTYGFLAGTGFSLMYVSSVVVVGQYFDKRRPLAIGIASSGSGIGIFTVSAVTGALLKVISWRMVSIIEGCLMILGILSGLTLRPLPRPDEKKESSKWKLLMKRLDITLFKLPAFDTICVVFILATIGCILPYMYLPDVAQELNIDSEEAAFLLSITGITNTISRMACGFIIYRFPILSPVLILAGICGVGGILSFFVFHFTTYASLAFYAAVVGFVYAADAALTPLLLIEIVGYERLNSSVGFMCMFRGFPILIAGPVG